MAEVVSQPAARRPSLARARPPVQQGSSTSLWRDAANRFRRDRVALGGGVILLLIILLAVFAPLVTAYDPNKVDSKNLLLPPGPAHPFGTDNFGRDVFTRTLYGGRLSLQTGVISVGIAITAGLTLGLIAGFRGSVLDSVLMRLMDIMLAFPGILLALAVVAVLGPSLVNLMIAVGISHIPSYTRVVRASVLGVKNNVYVDAARAAGCAEWRIIAVHVMPNALTSITVVAALGVGTAILTAASLSFLGLGVQPPTAEWGIMISDGREYLRDNWWVSTFPGLFIMMTVLAINLLGDGLQEAMDPRRRIRR